MRRLVFFDAYASSDEVAMEIGPILRTMPGVVSYELLEARDGSPRYCLVLEVADAQDQEVAERLQRLSRQYADYVTGYTSRAFRRIA